MNARPRVVLDARMVGRQGHGIARYVEGLLEGLCDLERDYSLVALVGPAPSDRLLRLRERGLVLDEVRAPFLAWSELLEIPQALRRLGASLYHSPSFSSLWYCPCPHVQTVHDLNHLSFGGIQKKIYYQLLLKRFALRARALMTVSDFAREEISAWLGIEPTALSVIRNPIEVMPGTPDPESTLGPLSLRRGAYFVALANRKPHKNLEMLERAHSRYREEGGAWPLFVPVGEIDDARLSDIVSGAGALLSPSLYEGFGRPPIEALLAEVPVVVSDIPAHREAVGWIPGSGIRWADPSDPTEWSAAMKECEFGQIGLPSDEARWDLAERHEKGQISKDLDAIYRAVLGKKE